MQVRENIKGILLLIFNFSYSTASFYWLIIKGRYIWFWIIFFPPFFTMKSMSCLDFSEPYRIKRFIILFTSFFFWNTSTFLELVILYGLFVNLIRNKFNSGKIINISTVLDCSAFPIYCKYCNFNALQCESSGWFFFSKRNWIHNYHFYLQNC